MRAQAIDLTAPKGSPSVSAAEIARAHALEIAQLAVAEKPQPLRDVELASAVSLSEVEDTDLLEFALTGGSPEILPQLKAFVDAFFEFRPNDATPRYDQELADVSARMAALKPRLDQLAGQIRTEATRNGQPSSETKTRFDTVNGTYTQLVELQERLKVNRSLGRGQTLVFGGPATQTLGRVGTLPTRTLRLILSPIVGLLLGLAGALLLGMVRPRVIGRSRTELDLERPVIGTVPSVSKRALAADPVALQRRSLGGLEGIRLLRSELELAERRGHKVRIVLVTSPEPKEGKSVIARNLAASLAAAGRRTLLLRVGSDEPVKEAKEERLYSDATASRTMTGELIAPQRLPIGPDLEPRISARRNPAGFDEATTGDVGLSTPSMGPSETTARILHRLRAQYETIVIDGASLLTSADTLVLAAESDAVMLVLHDRRSLESRAEEAIAALARHETPLLGIVLNRTRSRGLTRNEPKRPARPETAPVDSTETEASRASR